MTTQEYPTVDFDDAALRRGNWLLISDAHRRIVSTFPKAKIVGVRIKPRGEGKFPVILGVDPDAIGKGTEIGRAGMFEIGQMYHPDKGYLYIATHIGDWLIAVLQGEIPPMLPSGIPWCKPTYLNIDYPDGQVLPTLHEEITQEEFMRGTFLNGYSLEGVNYHQLHLDGGEGFDLWGVHFWFYHDSAYAYAAKYVGLSKFDHKQKRFVPTAPDIHKGVFILDKPYAEGQKPDHGYIIRYFRIGCQHKNLKHLAAPMFDQHYQCPDCGFEAHYDSSG